MGTLTRARRRSITSGKVRYDRRIRLLNAFLTVATMAMLAGVSLNSLGEVLKAALVLPVPRIDTQITPSGSGYEVTLKSPTLARSVYLSFGGQDATYSDNYFDLLRGSPLLIHLDSKTSLETLRTAMQVKSLATSFKQSQTQ